MRILITGGYGYVGGRLAQHLEQEGHQVVLGTRMKKKPPDSLLGSEIVKTEWDDERALARICAGFDVVVHAAGMNSQECAANPVAALAFNGLATARIFSAAGRANVKRFIYLSTAHVYARPLKGSISEDNCPLNKHPYATSHLAGENAVLGGGQGGQVEGIVMRLSNAFGAPMHKGVNCWMLLVNDLCRQAVITRRLVLQSAGLQRRDFVTIHDVSRAVSHMLTLSKEQISAGVFNMGGAWAPRVVEMAELIQARCSAVFGFLPDIVSPSPIDGEVTSDLTFDVTRLRTSGYELTGHVEAEIDATLLFCRENFGMVA